MEKNPCDPVNANHFGIATDMEKLIFVSLFFADLNRTTAAIYPYWFFIKI